MYDINPITLGAFTGIFYCKRLHFAREMAESDHNSKTKSIYNGPRSTTISSIQHANNAAKSVQLSDASGAKVALAPIGAAIQAIHVPTGDRSVNVVLGYESASRYASNPHYLGTTVGRYAGRIRNGRFPLNGQVVRVASDSANGGHCLHGGPNGLHARAWDVDSGADATSATFRTRSEHGEEGFPGTLDVSVRYTLAAKTLVIEYFATSDADTALNLTNHAYFNLKGSGLVDGQQVTINADSYAPVDAEGIPTGEIRDVSGL